jgi:hypothetical protein
MPEFLLRHVMEQLSADGAHPLVLTDRTDGRIRLEHGPTERSEPANLFLTAFFTIQLP